MRALLTSLAAGSMIAVAVAQQQAATPQQTGTPARLEAINGKMARVFLQGLADGNLTFQPFGSPNNMTVETSKVRRFEFYPKFEVGGAGQSYAEGDYPAVLQALAEPMQEFAPYMSVSNNLQEAYVMLMDSYLRSGDAGKAEECAALLLASDNPVIVRKGKSTLALAAAAKGDFQRVEELRSELDSPAGSLFLQAIVERANQQPKAAIQHVAEIIADHGNDLEWMPQAELLSAQLYLDMGQTNSAALTARQVKNIYAGSNIAADAAKLQASLGLTDEPQGEQQDEQQSE